jgi:protein-tyrosine phosphatase
MPPVVIKIEDAPDVRDVIHHTVEAISSGKVVAIPTETVYGLAASALVPGAVERIAEITAGDSSSPIAFAVKSLEDAIDFVPNMNPAARRIARRSWPGPVTLVLTENHPDSVVHRLDERVKKATIAGGKIALRSPANEFMQQVLRLCAGPVVLTGANLGDKSDAVTAQDVINQLGDKVDVMLDGGPTRLGIASTVVQVLDSGQLNLVRVGSVDAETVNRLANFLGLVVCTGNTCRSPMAEALFKKMVAEKVGCDADQLIERGIQIASAGIAAMSGAPAAEQATAVMKKFGMEIGDHASQPVSDRSAQAADLILTMTNGHRHALVSHWPMLEPRTRTLRIDGGDISDPIGCPVSVYESCAQQIEENLRHWVDQVDWSQFGKRD